MPARDHARIPAQVRLRLPAQRAAGCEKGSARTSTHVIRSRRGSSPTGETRQLARVHMHHRRNVVVYTLPRPTVGVSSNEEHSARGIGSSDVGEKKGIKEYNNKCEMSSGESCALSSLCRFANSGVLRHQGAQNSRANSRSVVVVFTNLFFFLFLKARILRFHCFLENIEHRIYWVFFFQRRDRREEWCE